MVSIDSLTPYSSASACESAKISSARSWPRSYHSFHSSKWLSGASYIASIGSATCRTVTSASGCSESAYSRPLIDVRDPSTGTRTRRDMAHRTPARIISRMAMFQDPARWRGAVPRFGFVSLSGSRNRVTTIPSRSGPSSASVLDDGPRYTVGTSDLLDRDAPQQRPNRVPGQTGVLRGNG